MKVSEFGRRAATTKLEALGKCDKLWSSGNKKTLDVVYFISRLSRLICCMRSKKLLMFLPKNVPERVGKRLANFGNCVGNKLPLTSLSSNPIIV